MSASRERLNEEARHAAQAERENERAARRQSESAMGERMQGIEEEQRRLAEELASLSALVGGKESEGANAAASDEKSENALIAAGISSSPSALDEAAPEAVKKAEETISARDNEESAADQADAAQAFAPQETAVDTEGRYALQLIGFFDYESLARFVSRKGLPGQVYSLKRTYKERPWYVVIHSLHENYAAAEKELARLPPDLAALNPWIRPLSQGTQMQVIQTGTAKP
jgi:DamX protein